MKKKEIIFIAVILLIAGGLWLGQTKPWERRAPQDSAATEQSRPESEQTPAPDSEQTPAPDSEQTPDLGSIEISVSGDVLGVYDLAVDQTIQIGETNTCVIKDGKATMTNALCPDHLCMSMSPIDGIHGGLIVCLPNQVLIEGIKAENSNGVDAIG